MRTQNWSRALRDTAVLPVARYLFPDLKSLADELFSRNLRDAHSLRDVFEACANVFYKLEEAGIAVREIEIGGPIVNSEEPSITGQALLDLSQDLNRIDPHRTDPLSVYIRSMSDPITECELAIRRLEEFAAIEIVPISRGETSPAVVAIVEGSVRCFGRVPAAVFACRKPKRDDLIAALDDA